MKLDNPKFGTMSLEEALSKRRSIRSFAGRELTWDEIGQLLWAGQGITSDIFRTSPSAGATYPMELYVVMKKGFFRYVPETHSVDSVTDRDLTSGLVDACYGQGCVAQASANFVICAVEQKIVPKYGQRSYRYIDMEAGHIAQNIHLQAVTLGLGSVPVGAFNESVVRYVLSVSNPIYIVSVGN